MKIQYGFYLFINKYLKTICHNGNIYLPQHYFIQLCKACMYAFTVHRGDR